MSKTKSQITAAIEAIRRRDEKLGEEMQDRRRGVERMDEGRIIHESFSTESAVSNEPMLDAGLVRETIVLRTGRPVLRVVRNAAELVFDDADSEVWRDRLTRAREQIGRAILASGRIELENHQLDWVGTGWLLRPDVIVTNRHVAEVFARRHGDRFVFRTGTRGRSVGASIDFLEEHQQEGSLSFKVRDVIHIVPDEGPDVAFLRVVPSSNGDRLAQPLDLASEVTPVDGFVATIGYPARDSRIPEHDLMERIFGNVFDKKRLAPGQITQQGTTALEHDCSTLGGNSGSVVFDLDSGKATGLHFAGRFLEANFAVPAPLIAAELERALRGGSTRSSVPIRDGVSDDDSQSSATQGTTRSLTYTIPIKVTVEIGDQVGTAPTVRTRVTAPDDVGADIDEGDDDELFEVEARPEDYLDRKGYDARFLGSTIKVPLPKVVRDSASILRFEFGGKTETELRYQHFSVMMNEKRRLCFFSAVNIDGGQTRKAKRPGWRLDPRVQTKFQVQKECYGDPPKFSRGHMTRREDPIWGSQDAASRGNADSMHVTNAVPQMQVFNAGIWLGLEDYALEHCREDDMRICVFTGPVFRNNDPVKFGVKISAGS